jgi:hypothetical protein
MLVMRSCCCRRLVPLMLTFTGPAVVHAQTRDVTVRVTDRISGLPLANAEVIERSNGRSRMTDTSGSVHLDLHTSESFGIRVRQVGYGFVDTLIARSDVGTSINIPLSRVTYALPPVPVTTRSDCSFGADTANAVLAATALEQLRMGAERYEIYRRQHPFRARVERRTKEFSADGSITRDVVRDETVSSDQWGERYVPGRVLSRERVGFSVPIPFIANLADPVFWRGHCFEVLGIESLKSERVLRLSFRPSRELRTPDWEGFALLDSATSELRRIEFRLTNVNARDVPRRLEGYTTFRSPSPFIVLPESTAAIWWRREPGADLRFPDVLQVLRLKGVSYRASAPPN